MGASTCGGQAGGRPTRPAGGVKRAPAAAAGAAQTALQGGFCGRRPQRRRSRRGLRPVPLPCTNYPPGE